MQSTDTMSLLISDQPCSQQSSAPCSQAITCKLQLATTFQPTHHHTAVLQGLKAHADNKDFQAQWRAIKYQNKERLAAKIKVAPAPQPARLDLHSCCCCRPC